MLASAPLIVLLCFLLSYLKGLNLLLLFCAATLLYCVRRHTFKPAARTRRVSKSPPIKTYPEQVGNAPIGPIGPMDERAMKIFWQSGETGKSNVYSFVKSLTRAEL
jgi:hypothetical protein